MNVPAEHDVRGCLVDQLRRQLRRWEVPPSADGALFSSGSAAIDRLLPGGGLRHGMLVEWLAAQPGNGVATLSLVAAREACRQGGALVVLDRRQTFYPPAAAAWGVDLRRLIVVCPRNARDELWAAVQSLRSPAVAAVWAAIDRLDQRALRRLQLAAQAGHTLGLIWRPDDVRGQPSWADVRLEIRAEQKTRDTELLPTSSRRVQVRVLRVRSGRAGQAAMLEIDDTAHAVREVVPNDDAHPLLVASELADPTARPRSARA